MDTQADASATARLLHRAGRWDQALAVLTPDAFAARAEILVDRHWWRLDEPEAAAEAVEALLPRDPVLAGHLDAQLRYTRLLFDLSPLPDDQRQAHHGFRTATADPRLAGWATFWLGVFADMIESDPASAAEAYRKALEHAHSQGDTLLESYAVRHLGDHLLKTDRDRGIAQLRRSYHLRAALGARPQTAAAALTLAGELTPGAEADQLHEAAELTARELQLTWLTAALRSS
ncbi:hypothetical protein FB565_006483 [Actinoplanes lutulentus]|uniref:Tetratricopeptide repeat protein n=1 Tax=Actinoplanes lutulentus TaxID=1287878 RepID=A0A327ZFC7_9ACTN|nr:hypothetical protein [Actinoplanes lutulentus]MBB2946715.1 hypothetical protein [Actinoplanes lutulentus]RAK35607.1 hypothetical protein B0I29_10980 [Actinoplanes lutulentus]